MQIKLTSTNKRLILVASFVVILVFLFSLNSRNTIKNTNAKSTGLVYGDKTLTDVINTDSDGDGILDWEEGLWGTDPLKKDSDEDGTEDSREIAFLKGESSIEAPGILEQEENLTETEKFSREIFTTVATLTQAGGELDQDTINKLSVSLIQQIENSPNKKVYLLSDIKTTTDNSNQAVKAYYDSLVVLFDKHPIIFKNGYKNVVYTVHMIFADVFQKFLSDDSNEKVLSQFDLAIKELRSLATGMAKIPTPTNLSVLHLNVVNGFEKVAENLIDLKSIKIDPIIAMGAASGYRNNSTFLGDSLNKLEVAINQKLNIK